MYNTRPFSSDNKEREKKAMTPYEVKTNKLFGYDTFSSGLKSAYEQKLGGSKVGGISSMTGTKGRKESGTKPYMANDRPSSANN